MWRDETDRKRWLPGCWRVISPRSHILNGGGQQAPANCIAAFDTIMPIFATPRLDPCFVCRTVMAIEARLSSLDDVPLEMDISSTLKTQTSAVQP